MGGVFKQALWSQRKYSHAKVKNEWSYNIHFSMHPSQHAHGFYPSLVNSKVQKIDNAHMLYCGMYA